MDWRNFVSGTRHFLSVLPVGHRPLVQRFSLVIGLIQRVRRLLRLSLADVFATMGSPDAESAAFELLAASDTTTPVRASGELMMVPNSSIDTAPMPDLVVVSHFYQPSPFCREVSGIRRWIVETHRHAVLTMSICTGALQLVYERNRRWPLLNLCAQNLTVANPPHSGRRLGSRGKLKAACPQTTPLRTLPFVTWQFTMSGTKGHIGGAFCQVSPIETGDVLLSQLLCNSYVARHHINWHSGRRSALPRGVGADSGTRSFAFAVVCL